MSTLNPTKKVSRRQELREDKVVTFYARAWDYFDKNRAVVFGLIGTAVAVIALIIAYGFYQSAQQGKAQVAMARAVSAYERGEFQQSLDGTADYDGLLSIVDNFGGTEAGNLARFYAGDALFRLGDYDKALKYFEDFNGDDDFIGASALAGEAAIYEMKGENKRAGNLYLKAVDRDVHDMISTQYLLDAGRAFEAARAFDDARDAYLSIKDNFPDSPAARSVDTYLARLYAEEGSTS